MVYIERFLQGGKRMAHARTPIKSPRSTENRINMRIAMRLPVSIRFFSGVEKNSARTVTRNISFNGACIESAGLEIQEGAMVHLRLEAGAGGALMIDALVVRNNGQSAGLMFAYYDNDVFNQLHDLLGPGVH